MSKDEQCPNCLQDAMCDRCSDEFQLKMVKGNLEQIDKPIEDWEIIIAVREYIGSLDTLRDYAKHFGQEADEFHRLEYQSKKAFRKMEALVKGNR